MIPKSARLYNLCKHFQKGKCIYGEQCVYAHDEEELGKWIKVDARGRRLPDWEWNYKYSTPKWRASEEEPEERAPPAKRWQADVEEDDQPKVKWIKKEKKEEREEEEEKEDDIHRMEEKMKADVKTKTEELQKQMKQEKGSSSSHSKEGGQEESMTLKEYVLVPNRAPQECEIKGHKVRIVRDTKEQRWVKEEDVEKMMKNEKKEWGEVADKALNKAEEAIERNKKLENQLAETETARKEEADRAKRRLIREIRKKDNEIEALTQQLVDEFKSAKDARDEEMEEKKKKREERSAADQGEETEEKGEIPQETLPRNWVEIPEEREMIEGRTQISPISSCSSSSSSSSSSESEETETEVPQEHEPLRTQDFFEKWNRNNDEKQKTDITAEELCKSG